MGGGRPDQQSPDILEEQQREKNVQSRHLFPQRVPENQNSFQPNPLLFLLEGFQSCWFSLRVVMSKPGLQ